MSGLVSFLIASTIFAAIGTAVRGLLRPISWALLALALGLFISNRLTGIPGSATQEVANQTTPGTTSDRPIAETGWQDVARELEPIYSDTLDVAQDSTQDSAQDNAQDNVAARGNGENTDGITSPRAANPVAGQGSSPAISRQTASPISGLW